MDRIAGRRLYLVISEEYARGRSAVEVARAAIAGGADILQMREKNRPVKELMYIGTSIRDMCRNARATFIVNDDPPLARDLDADGVHLGQEDARRFPVDAARRIVGRDRIIGVSTHSLEQLARANDEDIDYIAFGPVFPTQAKAYHVGTGDIQEAVRIAKKPVFFIGGITLATIDELLAKGAGNIALIRGITEAEDVEAATRQFKERVTCGT